MSKSVRNTVSPGYAPSMIGWAVAQVSFSSKASGPRAPQGSAQGAMFRMPEPTSPFQPPSCTRIRSPAESPSSTTSLAPLPQTPSSL